MNLFKATVHPFTFHFAFEAGTSRGVLKEKTSWFIRLEHNGSVGWGECSPIAGLSPEPMEIIEAKIATVLSDWKYDPSMIMDPQSRWHDELCRWPSLRFALETAWLDYQNGGSHKIFNNDFFSGQYTIPINGLVWMNTMEHMQQQIEEKLEEGYRCIKLKIGHYEWPKERYLIDRLRKRFPASQLMIRVDANGAYTEDEVYEVLDDLAALDVHSIEQPIAKGQKALLQKLCKSSPVPIALDEELIGCAEEADKRKLLETVGPPYLVLKPSLHGGFAGCSEWIALAEERGIGWWMTSYLESSIGLNAIAQYTANFPSQMYHGLGTGKIYTHNIHSPLEVTKGNLCYNRDRIWESLDSLTFTKR